MRNWQVERRLSGPKLSIGDCPGTRPSASGKQRSSCAAPAALTTSPRTSSNDTIAAVGSVSASAIDPPNLRRSREARRSTRGGAVEGSGAPRLGPFFLSHRPLSFWACPGSRLRVPIDCAPPQSPSLCSVLPKTIEIRASRASLAKAVTAENGAGAWLCLFAASYLCSHQVRGHEENERSLVSETH